jgi:hypothetical protein
LSIELNLEQGVTPIQSLAAMLTRKFINFQQPHNIDTTFNHLFMTKYLLTPLLSFFVITSPLNSRSQDFILNDVKNQMINDWTRAKAFTLAYLNAMPEEKYNFKPVDSVQNFAQQMIHLAVVDMFLVFMASDREPPAFTWLISEIQLHHKQKTRYHIM